MPPILRLDRPTVFLACICLLRIQTSLSNSRISDVLEENFPEYRRVRSELIGKLYDDVQERHPEWISEMLLADRHSREIEQMLDLVRSRGLCRRDRFPRDTRRTGEMIAHLEDLVNTPGVDARRVESVGGRGMMERAQMAERMEVDQDYLNALPPELREEVLMQQLGIGSQPTSAAEGSTVISRDFLDALPPDIRDEVLQHRAL